MEPKILYGKPVADSIYAKCKNQNGKKLAIITIGDDDASKVYVRNKIKACEKVGLKGVNYKFNPKDYEDSENLFYALLYRMDILNRDKNVIGIMIQQPYPKELKCYELESHILKSKDVDGLGEINMFQTLSGNEPTHYPATPEGILELLIFYGYEVSGKHVVVLGRSNIAGKPLSAMLDAMGATVSVCHSKTRKEVRKRLMGDADIIVSAVGKAKIWKAEDIGDNRPILIDVGTNRDENGKLCGDFDIESIGDKCEAYSPSPKGVGLTTVAMLIHNCCKGGE